MGNGECTWSRGKTGNRSREIVRRRLAARAIRSECDARDLLGLYRQRRSNPRFHQEHRKSDWDPKDFHGHSQASARSEVQRGEMNQRLALSGPLTPPCRIDNLHGAVCAERRSFLFVQTFQVKVE